MMLGEFMMEENTGAIELEKIIETINQLTEEDAKSLLKIIYGFVNTAMTGDGGDNVKLEILQRISDIFKRIPDLNEIRKK